MINFVPLVQSVQYWPSSKEDVEKMGDFTLELIDEHSFEDYITREMKIVEASVSKSVPRIIS